MHNKLIKTDYGYDYRGVAIIRHKNGEFSFNKITKFNSKPLPSTLADIQTQIDNLLNAGATVERYRIKVGA